MLVKMMFGALTVGTAGLLSMCELCAPPANLVTHAAPALVATSPTIHSVAAQVQAPATVTLDVQGMTCGGCVLGVRTVLKRLPGVTKADVRYETHQAVVTYDPAKVTVKQMIAAIATLKYTATPVRPKPDRAGA